MTQKTMPTTAINPYEWQELGSFPRGLITLDNILISSLCDDDPKSLCDDRNSC